MTNFQGTHITTKKFGPLCLQDRFRSGEDGDVYFASDPELLVKVCNPKSATTQEEVETHKRRKKSAYRTFSNLNLQAHRELSCLPQEYVELPGMTPGYVMRYGKGQELINLLNFDIATRPLEDRYRIGIAIANAFALLHSSQIVHADFKLDNYILAQEQNDYVLHILDIDSGGYCGPTSAGRLDNIVPTALPWGLFAVPELVNSVTWKELWLNPEEARQPDLWGLAILFYLLLVDPYGPFPEMPNRQLAPGLPPYEPYKKRAWAGDCAWPKPWQRQLMHSQNIPTSLINSFQSVFDGERDITRSHRLRLSSAEWRARLHNAQTQSSSPTYQPPQMILLPPQAPTKAQEGNTFTSKAVLRSPAKTANITNKAPPLSRAPLLWSILLILFIAMIVGLYIYQPELATIIQQLG